LDEYDQLIETLLESNVFDFTEATNEFNKIVENKFKNINVDFFPFTEEEMRIMWTYIENSKLRPRYERKTEEVSR
jgi:UDP-N-acetyl-D-mannosaminuronate dehydrogenase